MLIQGELGDGCTSLENVRQQRIGDTFIITVTSRRQGEVCTMIMQLLNEWVALEGELPPGEYNVRANGVGVRFRLVTRAGRLAVDPDPGPIPQPPYVPPPGTVPPPGR